MILSNKEIQKALDTGRLKITPTPEPLQPTPGGPECPYGTHSVDLKLGYEISVPTTGTFVLDLTIPGSVAETIAKNSEKHRITSERPYILKPRKFVLALTLEEIELPIDTSPPYLAARIEGKSSRARCGVLVHFTAPTVHPGFRGPLTLEMINFGPSEFVLRPEMPIAQLIVEEVKGELIENESQFQDQKTPDGLQDATQHPE